MFCHRGEERQERLKPVEASSQRMGWTPHCSFPGVPMRLRQLLEVTWGHPGHLEEAEESRGAPGLLARCSPKGAPCFPDMSILLL